MRGLFLFVSVCIYSIGYTQEMQGLIGGNNHVNYSSSINPSSLHNSKSRLEINLIGLGAHLNTRNVYLEKSDVGYAGLFNGSSNIELMDRIRLDTTKQVSAYQSLSIVLPSITYIHKKHAFSLKTRARQHFYLEGFSGELTVLMLNEGLSYRPYHGRLIENENVKLNAMAWGEVNFGYAYLLQEEQNHKLSVGVNIKRLYGATNLNIQFNNIDFTPVNNSTLTIHNMDMTLNSAFPFDPQSNQFSMIPPLINKGKGWGFDLGFTYYYKAEGYKRTNNKKACKIPYQDYDYRVGVSLVDIGYINFKENSWKSENFQNGNGTWYGLDNFQFNGVNDLLDSLNNNIFNDEGRIVNQKHSALLPAAISLQGDVKFRNDFFIGANWIHGLQYSKNVPIRPSVLAVTPRYEYKHFEAALPFVLYNYRQPRLGLFLRYRFLSIGTDRLGAFLNPKKFSGFDVYASITFRIKKGKCRLFSKRQQICPAYETGGAVYRSNKRRW